MPPASPPRPPLVTLDLDQPIWERFFMVHPLVVIGTLEANGDYNLAPRHMAIPLGWDNHFGFMCSPGQHTYANVRRTGAFTVSLPRPTQVVLASLAASGRRADDTKPILRALPTAAATVVDGRFLADAQVALECRLERVVDGFGPSSLVAGRIVAAHVDPDALRTTGRDDGDLIYASPLLAYLYPGRFARIDATQAFPFPRDFKR